MSFKITFAQLNPVVGSFKHNLEQVLAAMENARSAQTDLLLFPEFMLTAYPPEDLLFRPRFLKQVDETLQAIVENSMGLNLIIGAPFTVDITKTGNPNSIYPQIHNGAIVIQDGKITHRYAKQHLPNYRVFDEKRYFIRGNKNGIVEIAGKKMGILICEDIWQDRPIVNAKAAGAEHIVVLNASPFRANKTRERIALLEKRARENSIGISYVNLVGGQDELLFDGESLAVNAQGELTLQAPQYETGCYTHDINHAPAIPATHRNTNQRIYNALVLGVRDYVHKNGFKGVLLGLSGGIDSALTLAIAVDALGADNVEAVMMPFRYTSAMSISDAQKQAETLGVNYREIPIESIFESFMTALSDEFEGLETDTTEENIQARSRGVLLMAMSNKLGKMLLATGNKSEMSVGYATLYGDMAGGFSPLKDVFKTRVYALAKHRNSISNIGEIIPERVITRPPSAELAPDQKDEDSLPPYEVLDPILQYFVEEFKSVDEIVDMGFERETVQRIANLVLLNEYKRRQSAPGLRISKRAFGKDRRYPITSHYRFHL